MKRIHIERMRQHFLRCVVVIVGQVQQLRLLNDSHPIKVSTGLQREKSLMLLSKARLRRHFVTSHQGGEGGNMLRVEDEDAVEKLPSMHKVEAVVR